MADDHEDPPPIVWTSEDLGSVERFAMERSAGGWSLTGLAELPIDGALSQISYTIVTDSAWLTRTARIDVTGPGSDTSIALERADQRWLVNGDKRPDLGECVDVDLGWSPSTNTLPIRRLRLGIGQSAETTALWVRFPELSIAPLVQSYQRTSVGIYEYRSANFAAELTVDQYGRVTRYGDGIWVEASENPAT